MFRGVVNGEPIPDLAANLCAENVRQGLAAVDIQVVYYQMNGLGFRILQGQVEGYLCELKRRPVRRGEGEVPTRLRLYSAENIRRAAALVFAIRPGFAPRHGRRGRADVGVQRDWLLIQATTGFLESYGCSYVSRTSSIWAM